MTDSPHLLELGELDEGIREVVRQLRMAGFETCDSGNGRKTDMACAIDRPHVFMQVSDPDELVDESRRLLELIEHLGITVLPLDPENTVPSIDAAYDPLSDTATLHLWNVTDDMLRAS